MINFPLDIYDYDDYDDFEAEASQVIEASNEIAFLDEDDPRYDGREEIQVNLVTFWEKHVGFPVERSETLTTWERNI